MQDKFFRYPQGRMNHKVTGQKRNRMVQKINGKTCGPHVFSSIVFKIEKFLKQTNQKPDHQPTGGALRKNV